MGLSRKRAKQRMKSIRNTMQITRAMQLVASSALPRARERMACSAAYQRAWERVLRCLMADPSARASTLCQPRTVGAKCCCVMVAGDRGLAGGFHSNLVRTMEKQFEHKSSVCLFPIGRRAADYGRAHGYEMIGGYEMASEVTVEDCGEAARVLVDGFRSGRWGEVTVVYTRFVSVLQQIPTVQVLLPLSPEREELGRTVYEPSACAVLDAVIGSAVAGACYQAVCQSRASELAARSNAMDSAVNNASDMLEEMQLAYHRARQSAITQEITEIVSGAAR